MLALTPALSQREREEDAGPLRKERAENRFGGGRGGVGIAWVGMLEDSDSDFRRRHPRGDGLSDANSVDFQLVSPFQPAGDQPQAIEALVGGLRAGRQHQVLMGVTGSGKTFTMANVIQNAKAADAGALAQ